MESAEELGFWYLTSEDGLSGIRFTQTIEELQKREKVDSLCSLEEQKRVKERQKAVFDKLAEFELKEVPTATHYEEKVSEELLFQSRDYNEAFQSALRAIRALRPNTRRVDRMRAYSDMAHVGEDFLYTVKTYGRIIISEAYLPTESKTIKPKDIGGIAGGDKYIVQNILFKFAVDSKGLYGHDLFAMKVAGHELKALTYLFNGWMSDIYFPLLALVDYRGYRMVGMTVLPIDGDSQVYGSSDAGKTIFHDTEAVTLLDKLAKRLNLQDHPVAGGKLRMSLPIDLEAHEGFDDNLYLLDFSRTLPPQVPPTTRGNSYLYQHLRPEFVQSYKEPLCSDAFSPFIRLKDSSNETLNAEVKEIHDRIVRANNHLIESVIPGFVSHLMNLSEDVKTHIFLVHELHFYGINVRYLSLVYSLLNDPYWKGRVLVEMISRILKDIVNSLLREKMKELKYPGEVIYRRLVVQFLNVVAGSTEDSALLWNEEIYFGLLRKFQGHTGDMFVFFFDKTKKDCVRDQVMETCKRGGLMDARNLIFLRVAKLTGLRFSEGMYQQLASGDFSFFSYLNPFDETDLEELRETVRPMNIISHSQGFMLRLKALMSKDKKERKRLLRTSEKYFSKAIGVCPNSKVSLRNYGDIVLLKNKHLAEHIFKQALDMAPTDTSTLFKLAYFYDYYGDYDLAEDFYLRSLEAHYSHSNVLCVYADFLTYIRQDYDMAERFYKAALLVDKTNIAAFNNYAIFLCVYRSKYSEAESLFCSATINKEDTENARRFLNQATFYHKMSESKKAKEHYDTYTRIHSSSLKMSCGKLKQFLENDITKKLPNDPEYLEIPTYEDAMRLRDPNMFKSNGYDENFYLYE